jgi:uncharacterized protein with beta-barrel porin domain
LRLKEEGFTESGTLSDLALEGRTTSSTESLLGVRYLRPIAANSGSFEARAIWGHAFGDVVPTVTGRISSALSPATFTVAGVPLKRDSLTLGATFSTHATSRLSLYGDIATELRGSGQTQYGLLAGLRYAW